MIREELRLLARHSAVYGVGNILGRVAGFLMIPVYTRYLSPQDYGIIELLSLTTDIAGTILAVGIGDAVYRFYFDSEEEAERKKVVSTAMITFGVIGLLGLVLLLLASGFLAHLILGAQNYGLYFTITFTSLWFNTLTEIGYNFLRAKQRSLLFVSLSTAKLISALSLNILFVVFLEMKVLGIILSTLICAVVFSAILLPWVLVRTGTGFSWKSCRQMLHYGLPLIPTNLAAFAVHSSDRFFLKSYASLADVGIYSLGYRIGLIGHYFVTSPFMQVWQPRRFEILKEENFRGVLCQVFTYYALAAAFFGLALSLLSREIVQIIATPAFYEAHQIIPLIVLSYLFFGFRYHVELGVLVHKKTHWVMYTYLANGVLNLILNFILIPSLTVWGAALATLACMVFNVALIHCLSQRVFPLHFEWGRIGKILAVAAFLYALGGLLANAGGGGFLLPILCKAFLCLSFPFLLLLLNFYSPGEWSLVRNFLGRRRGGALGRGFMSGK